MLEYTLPKLETFPKDAYRPMAKRLQGVKRSRADRRGWGPGWPDAQLAKINFFSANRLGGELRDEVHPLVIYLIQASNALGYDMRRRGDPGDQGGWGTFSNRAIKNSEPPEPSNHSWGLAVDQNTQSNPMSKTWRSTTPPEIVYLWESAGFFWGGRWSPPKWYYDPMHLEYLGRPEDVDQDLENAKAAFTELGGTTLFPTLWKDNEDNNYVMVRVLQDRLNKHGEEELPENGLFDNATDMVVRAFQSARGLRPDGVAGPRTWAKLNEAPATL